MSGAQPDPCLGDVRIGVEPASNQVAVIVDDGVFFAEQVVLDLLHIVAGERRAVGTRVFTQRARDVIDVTVVAAEMVVGVLCPFERREVVAWTHGTTGIRHRLGIGGARFVRVRLPPGTRVGSSIRLCRLRRVVPSRPAGSRGAVRVGGRGRSTDR
jgi:hypothetical protein